MEKEVLVLTRAGVALGGAISDWWNEIHESSQWQDTVFYLLSASYALVSVIALVQLFRIHTRVPGFGWTTQKLFHLMNFIVNAVRATEFGFHAEVFSFQTKVLTSVLLDLPGLFFFSTYTLLVLFWAEIYYQSNAMASDNLITTYLSVNGVVYAIQMGIWKYLWKDDSSMIENVFIAAVSFLAVLGFSIHGKRLCNMLKQWLPIAPTFREAAIYDKKIHEVGWVTNICFSCFLVRCIVRLFPAIDTDFTLGVMDHPILDLFYYMFTEVVPMALVLFILRKLPRKRVPVPYYLIT